MRPETLDYFPPPPPRRRMPWLVLIGIAAVISVVYWSLGDWGLYIGDYGPGAASAWRTGKYPVWYQVLESSAVGLGATAILYGLYRLGRRWLG